MRSANLDLFTWVTGYSGWAFYSALISVFGLTGYYSELVRPFVPAWLAVGVLIMPIVVILFVQFGELPDRLVARCHLLAAFWFMTLALGMELGHVLGYQPRGLTLYRVLAHIGWTFAWAGIYRRARRTLKGKGASMTLMT